VKARHFERCRMKFGERAECGDGFVPATGVYSTTLGNAAARMEDLGCDVS